LNNTFNPKSKFENCPPTKENPSTGQCDVKILQTDYFGFYWTAKNQLPSRGWMVILIFAFLLLYVHKLRFWPMFTDNIKVRQSQKLHNLIDKYRELKKAKD
jgi:hypothetical protein